MKAAPVPIRTNYDYLWWINFALKWQTVHMRTIAHVSSRNAPKITKEYMRDYYMPFYCTEDFQLWSMNNMDKKMKGSWSTYKWVCKDIIYEYSKDADYRDNKIKKGSLISLMALHKAYKFIDESMHCYETLPPEEYYEPANDFVQDST